ncbi:MAG: hypothetical protein SPL13_01230, partial [Clostridia bacterium]|nr:hypothetical protein [Clostridia bacterium]
ANTATAKTIENNFGFLYNYPFFSHTELKGVKMEKSEFDFTNPADSAWRMFEKTGKVSYYMLYKKLIKK